MRSVAFLHPFMHRYARGIERYVSSLSAALSEKGVEVDIVTWDANNRLRWPELESAPSVKMITIPSSRYFQSVAAVPLYAGHFMKKKYDEVIIHFADYGEAGMIRLLSMLGRKIDYSIVLHFPYSQVPHRYHSFVRTGLSSNARKIIAVSSFVAREAARVFGRQCEVVTHGVDTKQFRPDLSMRTKVRMELGFSENSRLFLTVAALEERKGAQHFIQALPRILNEIPDAAYVVVGSGPYLQKLREIAKSLGMESRVRFVPQTLAVAKFYQAADLFVIPAKGEASSMVSLEAMACGLPVMSSAHPPFDELIAPAWGILVNESSPEKIAEEALSFIRSPDRAALMKDAALRQILQNHRWESIASQYMKIFEDNP